MFHTVPTDKKLATLLMVAVYVKPANCASDDSSLMNTGQGDYPLHYRQKGSNCNTYSMFAPFVSSFTDFIKTANIVILPAFLVAIVSRIDDVTVRQIDQSEDSCEGSHICATF